MEVAGCDDEAIAGSDRRRRSEERRCASYILHFLFMQKLRFSVRSVWSRGMIPPSGGGGREFESRNGPLLFFLFCVRCERCIRAACPTLTISPKLPRCVIPASTKRSQHSHNQFNINSPTSQLPPPSKPMPCNALICTPRIGVDLLSRYQKFLT